MRRGFLYRSDQPPVSVPRTSSRLSSLGRDRVRPAHGRRGGDRARPRAAGATASPSRRAGRRAGWGAPRIIAMLSTCRRPSRELGDGAPRRCSPARTARWSRRRRDRGLIAVSASACSGRAGRHRRSCTARPARTAPVGVRGCSRSSACHAPFTRLLGQYPADPRQVPDSRGVGAAGGDLEVLTPVLGACCPKYLDTAFDETRARYMAVSKAGSSRTRPGG